MQRKRKATKARARPRARARKSGPSINQLIVEAVSASNERSGMSLPTLKKVLAASGYDVKKNQGRIRVAVRSLVNKGILVQTKGFGASASYKISEGGAEATTKRPSRRARPKAKKRAGKKRRAAKRRSKKPKKARKAKKSKRPKKARRRPKKAGRKTRARKAPAKRAARRKSRKTASKTH